MSPEILTRVITWVKWLNIEERSGPRELVFHGGEPLLAREDFYGSALPRLRMAFGENIRISLQSNLWLLTDALCELFVEYGVSLGTSLDGPEAINDRQRGRGYFRRTMAGIDRARRHGLSVGTICTFTRESALRHREVSEFFVSEGLVFSVRGATTPLTRDTKKTQGNSPITSADLQTEAWALSANEYGDLLTSLLDHYLENLDRARIPNLDSLCRSVSAGEGGSCTFRDCLGNFAAVAPNGDLYPCQRFVGHLQFLLGNVHDQPTLKVLKQSNGWRVLEERQRRMSKLCGECAHFDYCKGGCPYEALAAGDSAQPVGRDPNCSAYEKVYTHITDRALEEIFSDTNMDAIVDDPNGDGLLREGPILGLMRGDPHPTEIRRRARDAAAAVALAESASPEQAVARLEQVGLVSDRSMASASLAVLRRRLDGKPRGLLNLYVHVTYACNLRCGHCYADAGPTRAFSKNVMSVERVAQVAREAAASGFRKVVITGGEPLIHPETARLLCALKSLRAEIRPVRIVLRTSLATSLSRDFLRRAGSSVDQVVVSVDGDRATHDARRGIGSYNRMLANLRVLIAEEPSAEIVLGSVLASDQVRGEAGQSVRKLGQDLGGLKVRFKQLLPLGRAVEDNRAQAHGSLASASKGKGADLVRFHPSTTCGIGYSLYVDPDGETYPCYALRADTHALGDAFGQHGLDAVVGSDRFRSLAGYTVDSNRKCRACALRYLCGGLCRAWGPVPKDLDDEPGKCDAFWLRARELLDAALANLDVPPPQWLAAGLPLPEGPPQI